MNRHLPVSQVSLRSKSRIPLYLIVIVLALTHIDSLRSLVHAAPGDLDPTFGTAGRVVTDFLAANDAALASALQPDGKIVVVGNAFNGDTTDVALTRYNGNGSLDDTFGSGGKVATDFFGGYDHAAAVDIQADGKILIGGSANQVDRPSDFALARYNSDGSLDRAFGIGGKVTTDFLGYQDLITGIDLQPDGKIIAAGTTFITPLETSISLARYNADGSLDAGFGSNGKVLTRIDTVAGPVGNEGANALAMQRDGKIVVAGYVFNGAPTDNDFALLRLNNDGSFDFSFGSRGRVATDFVKHSDSASALTIQLDGKIIAGGSASTNTTDLSFALARYREDGSLDPYYGVGGKVLTIAGDIEALSSLALQTDGRLIAAGRTVNSTLTNDFFILRYGIDGRLDTSLGNSGKITTDFAGKDDALMSVLVQPDGKIIASGFAIVNTGYDFVVARYLGGPSFDLCLQDESNNAVLQFNSTTGTYQFWNCSGFALSGTGTVNRRGVIVTLEHNALDRRVLARNDATVKKGTASLQVLTQSSTFTITDRDTTNNTCHCEIY